MLGLAPIGAAPIAGNGQRFYLANGAVQSGANVTGAGGTASSATGAAPGGSNTIAAGLSGTIAVGSAASAAALAGQGASATVSSGAAPGSSLVLGVGNLINIARGVAVGVATVLGFADLFPPRRRTFKVPASGAGGMIPWQKPAAAAEFFVIDFTDALAGDVLADATLIAPDGVTITGKAVYAASVKFMMAGGAAGQETAVICVSNTQAGQRLVATALLDIL